MALLEIIACSLEDAVAAAEGGADRLEVCVHLELGGLTPSMELVEAITAKVAIPVRVMFRSDPEDLTGLVQQVTAMAALPVQGMVLGLLDARGHLDFAAMDRVLNAAPPHWGCTLHHAFDAAQGALEEKLESVSAHGRADRILYPARVIELASLQRLAGKRLRIVVGGGLTTENLPKVMADSGCEEFHFGRAARHANSRVDVEQVRILKRIVASGG